jgi:hypothetical protein
MKKYAKIVLFTSLGLAGAAVAYVAKTKDPLMNDALKHSVDRRISVENATDEKEN